MSDLLRLRDHSQPCEHGEYSYQDSSGWQCDYPGPADEHSCPGGREVVLTPVGLTYPQGMSGAMYRDDDNPPDQIVYVVVDDE